MTTFTSQAATGTYIGSQSPNGTHGSDDTLYAGADPYGMYRAILKFDISSIPGNAVASSATVSLWHWFEGASNTRNASIYRVLRNWTVPTWNRYNATSVWGTAGCSNATDYDPTPWATLSLSGTEANGQKDWTFNAYGLAELRRIVSGEYLNYGWILRVDTEVLDVHAFRSAQYATSAERPLLSITYTASAATNYGFFSLM